MENLFNFEYQEATLNNQDGTKSNFRQVFGLNGINMACPKKSYHIIKTNDISQLGQAFIDKGHDVSTFQHRNGEVIGLNIAFGIKPTKVGACNYNLLITVPNNGGGKGYLSINQTRLICTNGMVSNKTMHKDNYIKIPHTFDYKIAIKLMEQSIINFDSLLTQLEQKDTNLDTIKLSKDEIMFQLNKWFFEHEMPASQKNGLSLDEFRKLLVVSPNEIQSIDRYNQLKKAFTAETEYNKELNLDFSFYTVYATVTNYLSRRIEISKSSADIETQYERSSAKLVYFDKV